MRYTDEDIEFANLILTDRENLDDAKVVRPRSGAGGGVDEGFGARDVTEGICHGLSAADEYRF